MTGRIVDEWLFDRVQADSIDERLSELEPEKVIQEYFQALDNKDAKGAECCISKKALLGALTANMPDNELYNEAVLLPLTDADIGAKSSFDNLKSAKFLNAELIDQTEEKIKIFRVWVDLQYKRDLTVGSGEQQWDCVMVYESAHTGWKIEAFGH